MTPGRARDNQEWLKQAQALLDGATVVVNAAAAKNADKLADAGDTIYGACEACHNKYMAK
jgi:cytochrome c556